MSVWTYKDGEKELIAPELLDGQLEAGWSVVDPSVVVVTVEDDEAPDIGSGAIFDLSNEQVREQAKAAGIEDYDKLRIHTLKEMLNDRAS